DALPICREWILLVLLLILTGVAFAPALEGGFLWRDDVNVTANDAIASGTAWAQALRTPTARAVYRPVADALLLPQYRIWGNWNATAYHAISLLLHLVATALLFAVVRRLALPGALFAAALFALHPVAVQPVAWLSQQPLLLASVLALLATRVYLRFSG